ASGRHRTSAVRGPRLECGPFRRRRRRKVVPTPSDLLTLALLPGIGPRAIRELAGRGSLADVLADPEPHADLLDDQARQRLRNGEAGRGAEDGDGRATALGVRIVPADARDYPALLRRIFDPPAVLYVRGRLDPAEGDSSAAIVGARAATPAGRALARTMARE